jgi:lipooligosaccharide transport system permease protein
LVVLPHPIRARRVWWREFISWRRVFKTSVILNFGEPFLYLVAFGFALGAYVNLGRGQTYAAFVAPALIAVTAMNAVTFDSLFGSWNNMHDKRVFEAIVTAPITPQDLVLGEFFWQASRALLYGMTFALVMFAVGLIRSPWALALPLVLVLMGPLFAAPALTWASVMDNFEHLFYYIGLLITPMFFFSGVFFPLDRLPAAIRDGIWLVSPLYHAATICRALVNGNPTPALLWDAAYMVVLAVILAQAPLLVLPRRLQR